MRIFKATIPRPSINFGVAYIPLRLPVLGTFLGLLSIKPFRVSGNSMSPHYLPGQLLLVNRATYLISRPNRGDVVVLRHPSLKNGFLLKRIAGLPGEQVNLSAKQLIINGHPIQEHCVEPQSNSNQFWDLEWTLQADEYVVLGDNRSNSLDSRKLGPIKRGWIIGKACARLWPPTGRLTM